MKILTRVYLILLSFFLVCLLTGNVIAEDFANFSAVEAQIKQAESIECDKGDADCEFLRECKIKGTQAGGMAMALAEEREVLIDTFKRLRKITSAILDLHLQAIDNPELLERSRGMDELECLTPELRSVVEDRNKANDLLEKRFAKLDRM